MSQRIRTATLTAATVAAALSPVLTGISAHAEPATPQRVVTIHTFAGKCLDVEGSSRADGARIIQYRCHNGANQKFRLVGNEIRTFAGKCLDVQGGSRADNARIIQYRCHNGTNQQFRIIKTEIRTFAGKCLDVQGSSRDDATPIIQYRCHNGANQQFRLR